MTITRADYNSQLEKNCLFGSYSDDAATPAALTITCGFKPRKITWLNATDRIQYEWYFGMANGTTLKTVAAGTRTLDTTDAAISADTAVTGTAPVTFKGDTVVTIAAAAILQSKANYYIIED